MTKYHAVRTNGYASKAEARRADELKLLLAARKIYNLREQVPFDLLPADKTLGYSRPLRYIADFVFDEDMGDKWELKKTRRVVEDCKGYRTPVYKLKKRLMLQLLGIDITEV